MSDAVASAPRRRWRWVLAAVAVFLVSFTVLGFFAAPPIARSILIRRLGTLLHREVSVGRIRINPYTLSASVEDLLVRDRDGQPLLSWSRGFADFEIVSLFTRDWVFKTIEVDDPYARIVIGKDGSLNFSDILAALRAGTEAPGAAPRKPSGLRIAHVRVAGAKVAFGDLSRAEPFSTVLGPLRLDLEAFSTRGDSRNPYSFSGATESGETFSWTGYFYTDPLRSGGEFAIENVRIPKYEPYYRDRVPFRIREGRVGVRSSYRAEWGPASKVLSLSGAGLTVAGLEITARGSDEDSVRVPAFEISSADLDLLTGAAHLGSVSTSGGTIVVRRIPGGKIDLLEMLSPLLSGEPSTVPFSTGPITASGYAVRFEDRTAARPIELTLSDIGLSVGRYDSRPGTVLPVSLSFTWSESGKARIDGTVASSLDRGDLAIAASDLALRPLAPYIEPYVNLYLTEGRIGGDGKLRFSTGGSPGPLVRYQGDLRADGIASVDAALREDLVKGASFRLSPVEFSLEPLSLTVGEIVATRPFLRWIVEEDGSNNIMKVLRTNPPAGEGAPAAPPAAAGASAKIAIGKVRFENARLDFTDRLVKPNVAVSVAGVGGTITGLSSEQIARADVALRGKVDGYAPFDVTGKINPLAEQGYTDLAVTGRGIEMTTLGPYSGKYLGYAIRKGKLDLDLAYKVDGRHLDARNKLTMSQFELGDKTDSPDAVKVPVKLGVALLRDRHGQIVLDVPVDGDIGDPEFHLGKVIWRAIANVFSKIVTSPFTLLAKAFGGKEEELSRYDFDPGSFAVTKGDRLDPIVNALYERPGLSLEIAGTFDETADTAALKKQRLDRLVRDQKWKEARTTDATITSPEGLTVAPDEYARYLKAAYDEAFPPPPPPPPPPPAERKGRKPAQTVTPPPPAPAPPSPEEMALHLLETIRVSPEDLRSLAERRAKAVRDAILASGKVEAERVFLTEGGKPAEAGQGPRAEFLLR